jgi:hypothetical protein
METLKIIITALSSSFFTALFIWNLSLMRSRNASKKIAKEDRKAAKAVKSEEEAYGNQYWIKLK